MKIFIALTQRALDRCIERADATDWIVSDANAPSDAAVQLIRPASGLSGEERAEHASRWRSAAETWDVGGVGTYASLNDQFCYFVVPLLQHIGAVRRVFQQSTPTGIVIAGPSPRRVVPEYLVANLELPHGSRTLQPAALAHFLGTIDWGVPVRHVETDRLEFHTRRLVRTAFLRTISLLIGLRFVIRLAALRLNARAGSSWGGSGVVFLTRAEAQHRVARSLAAQVATAGVPTAHFFIPQFLQGSIRTDRNTQRRFSARPVIVPGPVQAIVALMRVHWNAWSPNTRRSGRSGRDDRDFVYRVGQFQGRLEAEVCRRDLTHVPSFLISKSLVEGVLSRSSSGSVLLVNFEERGREAVLERAATESLGTSHAQVQILGSAVDPLPKFPLADRYFTATPAYESAWQRWHPTASPVIRYCGSPYAKTYQGGPDAQAIVSYMTQPYEHSTNGELAWVLERVCEDMGARLVIRLHPRDSLALYGPHEREPIARNLSHEDLDFLLETSTVIVGRTTSVLGEASSRGVHAIACMFTVQDAELAERPFLQHISDMGMSANSEETLEALLRKVLSGNVDAMGEGVTSLGRGQVLNEAPELGNSLGLMYRATEKSGPY